MSADNKAARFAEAREAAIVEWEASATLLCPQERESGSYYWITKGEINRAVALMRSAPAEPSDDWPVATPAEAAIAESAEQQAILEILCRVHPDGGDCMDDFEASFDKSKWLSKARAAGAWLVGQLANQPEAPDGSTAPASSRLRKAAMQVVETLAPEEPDSTYWRTPIGQLIVALDAEPDNGLEWVTVDEQEQAINDAIADISKQRDEAIARAEQAEAALSASDPGRLLRDLRELCVQSLEALNKREVQAMTQAARSRIEGKESSHMMFIAEIDLLLATVADPDAAESPSADAGPVDADTAELELFLSQEARWHQASVERVVRNLARRELARGAK